MLVVKPIVILQQLLMCPCTEKLTLRLSDETTTVPFVTTQDQLATPFTLCLRVLHLFAERDSERKYFIMQYLMSPLGKLYPNLQELKIQHCASLAFNTCSTLLVLPFKHLTSLEFIDCARTLFSMKMKEMKLLIFWTTSPLILFRTLLACILFVGMDYHYKIDMWRRC